MELLDFEDTFLIKVINMYKTVKNKYLDAYLQTTRHHLLLYNTLNDQYQLLCNNHIINNNKHFFKRIDTKQKDILKHEMKTLILKQRELYYNISHYMQLHSVQSPPQQQEIINEFIESKKENKFSVVKEMSKLFEKDDTISIKSSRSTLSTTSNESKKSYKINRNKEESVTRIKLPKFLTKKRTD
jgi:hypothetical protein